MPAKRKATKVNSQKEQTQLLRMILAELRTLNANMAARPVIPAIAEPSAQENPDSDDEELEYFE